MLFVHNLPPLQSCGRGVKERGREGVVPFSVTHGQPQRARSITSGPGLFVGLTGRCGQEVCLSV